VYLTTLPVHMDSCYYQYCPKTPWRKLQGRRRLRLKCDGTRAETRFRLSAKRTSPFKSSGGPQFSRLLAAELCASAVVMLDTPCSEVVGRVLATHCIRQFPLHFSSRVSPCAITFQLVSNTITGIQPYTGSFFYRRTEQDNFIAQHAWVGASRDTAEWKVAHILVSLCL